jgi:hypothetical protein
MKKSFTIEDNGDIVIDLSGIPDNEEHFEALVEDIFT